MMVAKMVVVAAAVVLVSACSGEEGATEPAPPSMGAWSVSKAQEITGACASSAPIPAAVEIGEFDMLVRFAGATVVSNWKEIVYDSGGVGFVSLDTATFFAGEDAWVLEVATGTVTKDNRGADQLDGFLTLHLESSDQRCIVRVHAGRI